MYIFQEPKNKRNVRSRKSQKLALMSDNEEDGSSAGSNKGPSSNSSLSGDQHSNSSHDEELGGRASSLSPKGPAALNLSGKARATRGSATDPQSVYARVIKSLITNFRRIYSILIEIFRDSFIRFCLALLNTSLIVSCRREERKSMRG